MTANYIYKLSRFVYPPNTSRVELTQSACQWRRDLSPTTQQQRERRVNTITQQQATRTLLDHDYYYYHYSTFLFLFLLLSCCSFPHFTQAQAPPNQVVTYQLYSLKPFSVEINSPTMTPDAPINFASLGSTIQQVTETFLKEYIDAELLHDVVPLEGTIQGVSLQISVKRASQRKTRHLQETTNSGGGGIVALLSGSAAFELTNEVERTVADQFLQSSLTKAFSPPSLGTYEQRLMVTREVHLQQLTSMVVTVDYEHQNQNNGELTTPSLETNKKPFGKSDLDDDSLFPLVGLVLYCSFCENEAAFQMECTRRHIPSRIQ